MENEWKKFKLKITKTKLRERERERERERKAKQEGCVSVKSGGEKKLEFV